MKYELIFSKEFEKDFSKLDKRNQSLCLKYDNLFSFIDHHHLLFNSVNQIRADGFFS